MRTPSRTTRASHLKADRRREPSPQASARPKCKSFEPPPVELVVDPAPVTPFAGLTLAARSPQAPALEQRPREGLREQARLLGIDARPEPRLQPLPRRQLRARCSHRRFGGFRSLWLRYRPKFDRQCALFLIIVERLDEHVSREGLRSRVLYAPGSGAQDDLLGRARGDGWDAAGGPVPRAETRVPCLFKHLSLTRGEHVAWEDPRPRGTRLVAPRPPAFSPQAPPLAKHEVSAHPHESSAKRKPRVTDGSTRVV